MAISTIDMQITLLFIGILCCSWVSRIREGQQHGKDSKAQRTCEPQSSRNLRERFLQDLADCLWNICSVQACSTSMINTHILQLGTWTPPCLTKRPAGCAIQSQVRGPGIDITETWTGPVSQTGPKELAGIFKCLCCVHCVASD